MPGCVFQNFVFVFFYHCYYKKNLNAVQSLKGMLFEDKILNFIKSKIQLTTKSINTAEAEKIIKDFNSVQQGLKIKQKTKKISKK